MNDQAQSGGASPRVVVVGAGFGGLEAVRALARARAEVTLIDQQNHHCFQPLLYQVATAALSPADVAWPVRSILARQKNVSVIMAKVTGVDTARQEVLTDATGPVPYDFLILATGATHSYFGHPQWAPFAPGLKRIEDATEIRRRTLIAFERAEVEPDPERCRRLLTFVIVGGGPTGVELAGALAEVARHVIARDFRRIDPRRSRIVLVEAGQRVLPALPANLATYAQRSLSRMGVDVRTSTMVTQCDADGVTTASGDRIEAGTIIWAAGVAASPAGQWLGVETDRAGRIKVNDDLTVPGHPNIYAIGDTAAVGRADGSPVPGIAPAAKQMGHYVGRRIAVQVGGRRSVGAFVYKHRGDLATIGRKAAVVSLGRLKLKGALAWLFWSVAHIYFLIGTRHRIAVALAWLWDYATFQRGARLISERAPEREAPTSTSPKAARRPPREVIEQHLDLRREGKLEDDLRENYSPEVTVLTNWGTFKGHDGVRAVAARLDQEATDRAFSYGKLLMDGPFGFVSWQADGARGTILNGADSYVVRDGWIVAQSIQLSAGESREKDDSGAVARVLHGVKS